MLLRSLIVDDEAKSRQNLSNLLARHCPEISVIAEASGVMEGVHAIHTFWPDLVFLDIEMIDGTGFDLIEKLKGSSSFEVIFVTAYDQYGIAAIKACAIDYILKPISVADLKQSIEKACRQLTPKQENKRLKELAANIGRIGADKRIALPLSDKLEFIKVKDIIRLEADGNYTHFYMINNLHFLVCKTLKEYDTLLASFGFVRTHHSHLVNLEKVTAYIKIDGGSLQMEDGSNIPISRQKKESVLSNMMI